MRLLALRLLGFKSFPDQTELRFGPGVTAVVGPNGSGKSNIVDAIRWVLGEQNSRALRSPRVADLIFGGTAERKPLGMGQVTLVIDNSDETIPLEYSEINIMRRVHRSGESEFFINGTPCRLRDIQQLLLGTGLGRGGMAVVGQGEIDAILSADPADRRLLIEETAGTSRYTAQKRLAEQRLQRAGQDLARVLDLATELTARAETLKEQAVAAARYRELTEALQAHRASRAARDWLAARARLRQAEDELGAARSKLRDAEHAEASASTEAARAEAEVARLRQRLEQARAALHEAESAAAAAGHRLELTEMQWQNGQQRLESVDADIARYERERTAAEAQVLAGQETVRREQAAVDELARLLADAERRLAEYDAEYSRDTARVETARAELFEVKQTAAAHRSELGRIDADSVRRADEQARWQQNIASLEKELAAASAADEQARREAEAVAQRLQGRREDAERLALALQAAKEEWDARRRAVEAARASLQEAQAHRRALIRLEETHAGYRPAVKAVLGAAEQLGGVRGTVAQLLDVPARFDTAIQVALGGAAQYVVVDDERAVLRAIEHLRQRRAGRATFIALDTVRPRSWPADARYVLAEAGVLGVAAELVGADQVVRPIIDYLLGRILVVETLPEAQTIARRLHAGLRLVTVAGDLLVPGGPVTGGSAPSRGGDGLLSRRREQKELAAREKRAAAELARNEEMARAAAERLQALEQTAAAGQDDTQADTLALAELRQRMAQAEAERQRLTRALSDARARLSDLERDAEAEEHRAASLRMELETLAGRERELEDTLEKLMAAGREDEATRRRLADEAAEARARLAAREEALRAAGREIERWRTAAAEAAVQVQQLAEGKRRLSEEQRELAARLEQLRAQLPIAQDAVGAARRRLEEETATLAAATEQREKAAGEAKQATQKVAATREQVWSAEAAVARHTSAVESSAERLTELGLAPERAEEVAQRERTSIRAIREMEEELEALGAVNLGAEQELVELRERLEFLQEQQADLERAAEGLEQAIHRLDRVSQERFSDTFGRVARHFEETFRRLFGGGRAELSLLEDGGVDVHVQMPGKRSQHLLALSGGERSLTAIALMFALLRVQPSPFYVLDEIDAALDEANLGRFQAMLREASKDAQFVVITHRATTMEVADTLYGVTAAHAGVSTVVSLNLQEAIATTA